MGGRESWEEREVDIRRPLEGANWGTMWWGGTENGKSLVWNWTHKKTPCAHGRQKITFYKKQPVIIITAFWLQKRDWSRLKLRISSQKTGLVPVWVPAGEGPKEAEHGCSSRCPKSWPPRKTRWFTFFGFVFSFPFWRRRKRTNANDFSRLQARAATPSLKAGEVLSPVARKPA